MDNTRHMERYRGEAPLKKKIKDSRSAWLKERYRAEYSETNRRV